MPDIQSDLMRKDSVELQVKGNYSSDAKAIETGLQNRDLVLFNQIF